MNLSTQVTVPFLCKQPGQDSQYKADQPPTTEYVFYTSLPFNNILGGGLFNYSHFIY